MEKKGFSLIEILSPCPIYWRMDANEAMRYIDEEMTRTFPLGVVKDWEHKKLSYDGKDNLSRFWRTGDDALGETACTGRHGRW